MALLYLIPHWFISYSITLQVLFGVITGIVSWYSYKIYKLCDQNELRLLAIAFGSISASYFVWPILNFFFLVKTSDISNAIGLGHYNLTSLLAVYVYVLLFILGLSTLAYITFGTKNDKLYTLIASLSIIAIIFSSKFVLAFNFVSAVLLFYVVIFYVKRYTQTHEKGTLYVFMGFSLLFLGRFVLFMSSVDYTLFVVNHILEFAGYSLIMMSLLRVMRC